MEEKEREIHLFKEFPKEEKTDLI